MAWLSVFRFTFVNSKPIPAVISFSRKHWPVLLALGLYLSAVALSLHRSLPQTGGKLVYALDDPYIHMAIARSLSQHGVWGVTSLGFTGCSSAPLWTALLALFFRLAGVRDWIPLLLNLSIGIIFLLWLNYFLKRRLSGSLPVFSLLLAVIFMTALPGLAFTGLEHGLQTFFILLFATLSASLLSGEGGRRQELSLLALAPLQALVRFECLFPLLTVCILFALRRKFRFALLLLILGALPVLLYGAWSVSRGWYFLPNSVLLKGNIHFSSPKQAVKLLVFSYYKLAENPHLLVLLLGALALIGRELRDGNGIWKPSTILLIIFSAVTVLHLQFAGTLSFFRYDAYLVALGIVAVGLPAWGILAPWYAKLAREGPAGLPLILALSLALLLSPLVLRASRAFLWIAPATRNISQQQCRMAAFLDRYYRGRAVALNDIGAVCYYADIDCLDLFGLASLEVARLKQEGRYDSRAIAAMAEKRGVKIAILYRKWYDNYGGLPAEWIEVGRWRIMRNLVCGDDEITFYATDRPAAGELMKNLRDYSALLPGDVLQSGRYRYEASGIN
ncbi:MAG: hypothetical protein A3F83_16720 [Candidatus Glassbacteria bacterium RIFCSPLOWO2_12_FULL_58_11]|uniref:Glycosyltransferase RgtA/B/C/D-like domain-containing protein n=1 Tax=Candidatus Glassbacteria bacterium RIFCSPLOWO2_12_FULL_58_11 TaxID=1817867 RepID=A0A1F5YPA0_9BACT|nr:MAG: hypothetical protein A3F83_16720 [Candidatus Glassbacteria bacterium RIFCSPLOWO2_12_FULL_58_11]